MDPLILTPKKANSFLIVTIFSVLLIVPISVFAQDDNGVAILRQIGRTFAAIGEKASPAVVVLKVDGSAPQERSEIRGPLRFSPDGRGIIQLDQPRVNPPTVRAGRLGTRRRSMGLGFIVSADGHILTNHNVVARASKINAELADGRQFEARIVGTDRAIDIAVLKIDADDLPTLELGDVDALSVGDWVVGISNSMGMGRALSVGMVTAKGRSGLGMADIENFVQTDIILHTGDGGGPLLDLDGKVVGINTAIIGREQGLAISLAIPVNMVESAYKQIIETGTVERGFLGVAFTEIDTRLAKGLRLEGARGVIVNAVVADSAASKAGVERYDVIAEFNGVPIESGQQLLHLVASLRPGQQVELVVVRGGKRQTLTVTLGKRPSPEEIGADED